MKIQKKSKSLKLAVFLFSCFFVLLLCFPLLTQAQGAASGSASASYGLKAGLQQSATSSGLQSSRTLEEAIGFYLKIVFGLLASIFLILVIYAGITWMVAGGKKESVTKAKDTMINATIGLLVMLAAYSLTSYVIQKIASVV